MRWCRRRGRGVVAVEVMPDHVPLLVEVDPSYGVHRLVKAVKGGTSRVGRDEFWSVRSRLPTVWANSYFAAAAATGGAPVGAVGRYVEQRDW
jgi:putative transposase